MRPWVEQMEEVNCLNATYLIANCYYSTFLKISTALWYRNYRVCIIQQDWIEVNGSCVWEGLVEEPSEPTASAALGR